METTGCPLDGLNEADEAVRAAFLYQAYGIMATSDPKNIDQIERILDLSYRDQLYWAAGSHPWQDMTLPETPIDYTMVSEIDGNVTRMPPLGGRPCFGNPIAWAVHGVVDTRPTRKGPQKTRCGRCKARSACCRISEARLSVTAEVQAAYSNFRKAGGASGLASSNREGAKRMLGGLIQVLVGHGEFTSVNDPYALAWPVMRREQIRRQATLRQQDQRRRNAKAELSNGQIPEVLSMHMEVERQHRSIRFREYAKCKEAPLQIRIDPGGDNARFTADAWLARERRKIRRQSVTPYSVAKEMNEIGRSYGLSFEVLRDRIQKALKRIDILEAATFPESGEKVWDCFDAKIVLRELMVPPPYKAV